MPSPTVIFDLDGTLLDSLVTVTHYVNLALGAFDLPPVTREECRTFVGNGAALLIRRAMKERGSDDALFEKIYRFYNDAYNANPTYLTAPYPGVVDLLGALSAHGIAVGVLSNKPEEAAAPVVRAIFGDLVTRVVGGRDGLPLKPDPTLGSLLMGELGAAPESLVYVGDSGVDMDTGHALSARLTVGVTWGLRPESDLVAHRADVLVHRAPDLLPLILECFPKGE